MNWLDIGSTKQGDAYPLQKGANHLPSYIPIELLPAQKGILFQFIREDAFFGFARMLLEASRGLVLGYLHSSESYLNSLDLSIHVFGKMDGSSTYLKELLQRLSGFIPAESQAWHLV